MHDNDLARSNAPKVSGAFVVLGSFWENLRRRSTVKFF